MRVLVLGSGVVGTSSAYYLARAGYPTASEHSMPSHIDYEKLLTKVIHLVEHAGMLLVAEWQLPEGPRGSGDKADVDIEVESLLRPGLMQILNCDFWGEETGYQLTGAKHCWVVDPNDGTADFLRGYKGSAISVALLEDSQPVLGVVYAPVLPEGDHDCIAWAKGLPSVLRNGGAVKTTLAHKKWNQRSRVMISTAAKEKPKINSKLCSPAGFVAMPSIAYRLARVAAGDGDAGVSVVPVSAHDVAAGHALLIGAGGVLLDENGNSITYTATARMQIVSRRCFGGTLEACQTLVTRAWSKVFT